MQLNGSGSGLSLIADYAYDAQSRRTGLTRGNGGTTTYGYSAASRLTSLALDLEGAGTVNDANWAFAYNVAGQVRSRTLVPVYERTASPPDFPIHRIQACSPGCSFFPLHDAIVTSPVAESE